jgi:hypothetical protein
MRRGDARQRLPYVGVLVAPAVTKSTRGRSPSLGPAASLRREHFIECGEHEAVRKGLSEGGRASARLLPSAR